MTLGDQLRTLFVLVLLTAVIPLWPQTPKEKVRSGTATETEHIQGPHGLVGWTLNWPVPGSGYGDEKLPLTLVVAQNGHILRRIDGDAFVWNWIFWSDGKQVAYESGPLHFGLACVLYDLKKRREIARVDCYHGLPPDSPDWVRALETAAQKQP
jgi:hypothetical protein